MRWGASLVERLGELLCEHFGLVLLGQGLRLHRAAAGAVRAVRARTVRDQVAVLLSAFRVDQFLHQRQALVGAQVGVQLCQAGVGNQNPGDGHNLNPCSLSRKFSLTH